IRFFREMNLEPVIAIDIDGTMNENAGFLKGLKVKEARKKIIERLKEEGLLIKQQFVTHRTPICERSKDEIEFINMKEYYLKQIEFKEKMLEVAEKINFYAPESKKLLINWINSVSIDWPISRRRYYATEVPVWHCKKCGEKIIPPKGKYYRPWKEKCPVSCPSCGSEDSEGDVRVFDTWFDSSISPLYILKYSRDEDFFSKNCKCSLRPQGKEIVRTWLYYTLLKCYLLTGKAIFKDVWIHQHILDENGAKMSKSLGNVIDPQEILKRYGAEPFRLWCVIEGNLDRQDFRCSYERIEGAAKTLTKLWNVARFVSMFDAKEKYALLTLDYWIINELNDIIKECRLKYEKYDFHNPIIKLKNFLWETFASHYIELVKARAYNDSMFFSEEEKNGAIFTLNWCLDAMLKLLAPVVPFITYKLYYELKNKDIHLEEFPKPLDEINKEEIEFTKEELMNLNSEIWKAKKDKGVSLKTEIKEAVIPEKFKKIEKDIVSAHNIKKISYGNFKIIL
ncbi:MAG: class I tRNA ligase family protein, partial [Candidatus Woesearchaeota archaeon]